MKKTLALFLAVVLLCLALLPACTPVNADDIDTEIKKAYSEKYDSKCPDIEHIYNNGEFYAMFITNGYPDAMHQEIVCGYEFKYGGIITIDIYTNDELYTIKEAVDAGVLSEANVGEIHAAYKKLYPIYYTE